MIILKIIALLIAGVSIVKSYIDFRKKREPLVMFAFWVILWICAASIMMYPGIIDWLNSVSRGSTFTIGSITGMAFIFMLYIVYRVYTKAARIEFQQAELIRKLGLKSLDKNDEGE